MAKSLLDYLFKINAIPSTPAASTAFLKQVLAVVKPKVGATEDTITLCTTKSAVDAFTVLNEEVDELFDAGLSRVFVLAKDDLDLADILTAFGPQFFTILVSSDYSDAEIDAMDLGDYEGVVALPSEDDAKNETRAAIANTVGWHMGADEGAKNMFYVFGKFLSNASGWTNQQYIPVPYDDYITLLGDAENLFDKRISFVLHDDEFQDRLGLLACGGEAITKPYVLKNLIIDMQSKALSWFASNQPDYTPKNAALLEDEEQSVIDDYVNVKKWISNGTVSIVADQDNFTASGEINVAKPRAFWRVFANMRETLT